MEDALALSYSGEILKQMSRLNPCCNGRCTRTTNGKQVSYKY